MRPARAFIWSLDDIETCLVAVREEVLGPDVSGGGPNASERLRLAMELRLGVTLDEDLFDDDDITAVAAKILTRIQP